VDAVSLSGLMITVGFVVTVIGVVIGTSKGIKQLYQEEAAV